MFTILGLFDDVLGHTIHTLPDQRMAQLHDTRGPQDTLSNITEVKYAVVSLQNVEEVYLPPILGTITISQGCYETDRVLSRLVSAERKTLCQGSSRSNDCTLPVNNGQWAVNIIVSKTR